MDHPRPQYDSLICSAAQRLKGHQRRLFQAEVAHALCGGSPRAAERRFGWGRDCVEKGLHEAGSGLRCVENFAAKGAVAREVKDPQLAADIRAVVNSAEFAEKARRLGIDAKGNTPEELDAWTRSEIARWAEVAKAANISAD